MLLEVMREAADFAGESKTGTFHLPQRASPHQDALGAIHPVDAENLNAGVIVEAAGEIGLDEMVGGECAGNFQVGDREADGILDLARGEAGCGLERGTIEGERAIVVGEA